MGLSARHTAFAKEERERKELARRVACRIMEKFRALMAKHMYDPDETLERSTGKSRVSYVRPPEDSVSGRPRRKCRILPSWASEKVRDAFVQDSTIALRTSEVMGAEGWGVGMSPRRVTLGGAGLWW